MNYEKKKKILIPFKLYQKNKIPRNKLNIGGERPVL